MLPQNIELVSFSEHRNVQFENGDLQPTSNSIVIMVLRAPNGELFQSTVDSDMFYRCFEFNDTELYYNV